MSIILMVLDGMGVGAEADAYLYGDKGTNTFSAISKVLPQGINLPVLQSLGLHEICEDLKVAQPQKHTLGCVGKARHLSPGKGTTLGHWELVGQVRKEDFSVYHDKLPDDFVLSIQSAINLKTLHNGYHSSGTELVKTLGKRSKETGHPIIYTSNDSVLQFAAHEDIISLDDQYAMCNKLIKLINTKNQFGRVICRPFRDNAGDFWRTNNRRNFHNPPPSPNLLTDLLQAKISIAAVGIIGDIFGPNQYSKHFHSGDFTENIATLRRLLKSNRWDLIFTNVTDFDPLLHEKKTSQVAKLLEQFDYELGQLISSLGQEDYLIITADHGCDPTISGIDNTREYCPVILYNKHLENQPHIVQSLTSLFSIGEGIRSYFLHGKTILNIFNNNCGSDLL